METRIVHQTDLTNFELIETQHLQIGYYSQRCPLKTTPNEDSIGILTDGKQCILLIADGVGGSPNGEVASHLATSYFVNQFKKDGKLANDLVSMRQRIVLGIEQINQKLIHEHIGARTTLTACVIAQETLQSIQVGDSSLMTCGSKGLLKHKTIEHSPVGFALAAGLLKEKEALTHPERHIISNVLGDPEMHIDIGPQIELATLDTIFLCSDGILDNYTSEELIDIIRKESIADVLAKLTTMIQQMRHDETLANFHKIDDASFIIARQRR